MLLLQKRAKFFEHVDGDVYKVYNELGTLLTIVHYQPTYSSLVQLRQQGEKLQTA